MFLTWDCIIKILIKLAGPPVYCSGSNASSLALQFKWPDNKSICRCSTVCQNFFLLFSHKMAEFGFKSVFATVKRKTGFSRNFLLNIVLNDCFKKYHRYLLWFAFALKFVQFSLSATMCFSCYFRNDYFENWLFLLLYGWSMIDGTRFWLFFPPNSRYGTCLI